MCPLFTWLTCVRPLALLALAAGGLADAYLVGDESCRTVSEVFFAATERYSERPLYGTHVGDEPYRFTTFADCRKKRSSTAHVYRPTQVLNLASGLRGLGVAPGENVGLYSVNRIEWAYADFACASQSIVTVPLYDTLGAEAVVYIVKQSKLRVIVSSLNKIEGLLKASGKANVVQTVISLDPVPADHPSLALAKQHNVRIVEFATVVADGEKSPVPSVLPKPSDPYTVCYTSGTTGDPKGVLISHRNSVSVTNGLLIRVQSFINANIEVLHISYLPLAHMMERVISLAILGVGGAIGFFRGDMLKLLDDVMILKPTIFVSVPRLYNRIYGKIMSQVESGPAYKRFLFNKALQSKLEGLQDGWLTHSLYDTVVFKTVREKLGGRVILMATGAAPINSEVLQFMRVVMSASLIEGYGQTENCAAAFTQRVGDLSSGNVGLPLVCAEYKVGSVPEMNYLATDRPYPRGEILVRGPCVMMGYLEQPEKTKEAIDAKGWLHTGDIGAITPDGLLMVIDRLKNLFKLAQGEYIAAEKIEGIYGKSTLVAQVFVYGDSLRSFLIGFVVPSKENLLQWAQANGVAGDFEALCALPAAEKAVMDSMVALGKGAGLHGFEQVRAVHLTPNEFTVQNDLLTPTFKLKRPQLKALFKNQIESIYAKISD